ncbi:PfkB family carbohydrate kinase [Mangrovibacterium diazotrophicum]|uniref:Sugar/nucleoside kinase (Ribokinase family) n=1 Tax=Mangrovibacterium diazotrophicum TaxID=1261403 RepID=A0A419W3J7_9BACT|nr:PfkB family carbohydrate kinase [Mangrovibacterium diazotrophicum]RKD90061.1 sugar/nucleoside kinase (ribokinase family) [Mangrovibacterium diazotrophicum]
MPDVLFAGLTTIDIQYFVDQFPGSNQKIKSASPAILVGGPAANAAAAYAFLKGNATILTAIGRNPFRKTILKDFGSLNIGAIDFIEDEEQEAVLATVITSSNGDRAIVSHHPDDHSARSIDFGNFLEQLNPSIIMIDGFYPTMTLELCQEAKRREVTVVFDGGSWKTHLDELIPLLDIVICSADFMPPGCSTHSEVIDFFQAHGIKRIAISRGEHSILFSEEGDIKEIPVGKRLVIDSLGAGDFLHGAFCYYWHKGLDFEASLRASSEFASATCSYKGTRTCFSELIQSEFV